MTNGPYMNEEQMDYLTEMMNIAAGCAATALEQLFNCPVDVSVPRVRIIPAARAAEEIDDPARIYAGVRMDMLGDIRGGIFLLMPLEEEKAFIRLIKKSSPFKFKPGDVDITVLEEMGNIVAGVYLTAMHDFCKLNIYHTVPSMTVDMMQSMMDETMAHECLEGVLVIVIENEFVLGKDKFMAFFILLVVPSAENLEMLLGSIRGARESMD